MVLPGGPKASSATFTAFLEYLLVAYPVAPKVAVICDNIMTHRSQFVQRWLAAPTRGGGVVRGTLQPHDNSVERVWAALKAWRPTRRRWPSRGASARCTPSFGLAAGPAAGDGRAAQLSVAARGLRAEAHEGRLA